MLQEIRTEFFTIGADAPAYLIAEIGLNHNGDPRLAADTLIAAAESGASAVKFQLYSADCFIDARARLGDGAPGSLREFFRSFELAERDWRDLVELARSRGVDFCCSIFDEPSLALYRALGGRPVKIASCDITNRPLLEAVRVTGLPVLLSTGTADEDEVARALGWLADVPVVLLQCVSAYPAFPADYNLKVLTGWRESYGLPVGISDHCPGNGVSLAALALGACVVERHFTLDRTLPGPDHALSLEPAEFRRLGEEAGAMRDALGGDGKKRSLPAEEPARRYGRRGIYSARAFRRGAPVQAEDLVALRPGGDGIGPEDWNDLLGKVWRRDGAAGEVISSDMAADPAGADG